MVSKTARNQFAVPLYLITTVSFLAAGQIAYADQSVREILKRVESETYKMKEPVGQMLTLAPLASALARAGDLSAATKTVLKIPVSFRAVGADDVMQYQLKVGDIAGAQKIAASFSGNSEEKQWTLYKLAAASAGAHNWKLADEALRGLTGERWRSLALREVAEAKAKSGDLTGALSMIGQIPYGRDRVAVHVAVAAYHQLHLHTGAANQALKDAVAEAVSVPEDWGRPLAFIAVAEEYRRIGDIASARATLEQALANQQRISNQMYRMASLTDIAEEFAKIGDVDRAILLANMQPAGKDRDWAYRNIAPSMVERNSAKAITIIQRIQDRTTRLSAFRATATAQARQGRFAEAERTCRFYCE